MSHCPLRWLSMQLYSKYESPSTSTAKRKIKKLQEMKKKKIQMFDPKTRLICWSTSFMKYVCTIKKSI